MSRTRVVVLHFAFSLVLAVAVALLVFLIWFPASLRYFAGGQQLFLTIVGVDVVCGPLLTWLLFKTTKTRLALCIDLTLIAVIQLVALGYGLYSLASARPLAFVFEVDRFRVVSYADVPADDLSHLPDWARPWGLESPRTVGLRTPVSSEERVESFDAALQGIEISQRPQRWQDYRLNFDVVRSRSQSVATLRLARANKAVVIERALKEAISNRQEGETADPSALLWIPLVSRSTLDWVAILDPSTLRIRAYAPVDGFL